MISSRDLCKNGLKYSRVLSIRCKSVSLLMGMKRSLSLKRLKISTEKCKTSGRETKPKWEPQSKNIRLCFIDNRRLMINEFNFQRKRRAIFKRNILGPMKKQKKKRAEEDDFVLVERMRRADCFFDILKDQYFGMNPWRPPPTFEKDWTRAITITLPSTTNKSGIAIWCRSLVLWAGLFLEVPSKRKRCLNIGREYSWIVSDNNFHNRTQQLPIPFSILMNR